MGFSDTVVAFPAVQWWPFPGVYYLCTRRGKLAGQAVIILVIQSPGELEMILPYGPRAWNRHQIWGGGGCTSVWNTPDVLFRHISQRTAQTRVGVVSVFFPLVPS